VTTYETFTKRIGRESPGFAWTHLPFYRGKTAFQGCPGKSYLVHFHGCNRGSNPLGAVKGAEIPEPGAQARGPLGFIRITRKSKPLLRAIVREKWGAWRLSARFDDDFGRAVAIMHKWSSTWA